MCGVGSCAGLAPHAGVASHPGIALSSFDSRGLQGLALRHCHMTSSRDCHTLQCETRLFFEGCIFV